MADTKLETEAKRLTAEELEYFRKLLLDKRERLLRQAKESINEMEVGETSVGDELDQAVNEYDTTFEMRLRGRDKRLLKKINYSLQRMEAGEYDICESCGAPIGKKRLMARPEATLCIACKEDQERQEKMYQKKRPARLKLDI